MGCRDLGNRARIGLLLLCSAILPSCGGGPPSGPASTSRVNANPSVSRDGQLVVFESSSNGGREVVVVDRLTATSQVVAASGDVANSVVTPDGRFIAFDSRPADSSFRQVFVQDLTSNVVTQVSATSDQTPGDGDSTNPSISDDGGAVAFQSSAVNLGARSGASNSILLHDLSSGTTRLASSATPSDDVNPAISGSGQFVAFESRPLSGTEFAQVLLFNALTGLVSPVSQTAGAPALNGPSGAPSISFDGREVAFESRATNLTPTFPDTSSFQGESNILLRDVQTGALTVASVPLTSGVAADGDSLHPAISRDGRLVAFDSTATNLTTDAVVPGTSNIFVRDLDDRSTELITSPTPTTPEAVVATPPPPPTTTAPPTSADAGLSTGAPVPPTGTSSGLVTSTPDQPTGTASGLVTGTPAQPTGTTGGLTTSTPTPPTATGSGLVTSTPVEPTGVTGGLVTSTPVQPPASGTSLVTGSPVPPTGVAGGLVTSTPVAPTTPVVTTAEIPRGGVRPRLSTDGAWVVFESGGRIFIARRGSGEVSEIR
jgi:Tol biopolymer transport system component